MNKHKYDIQDENDSIGVSIRRIADLLEKTPTQKEYEIYRREGEMSIRQILYRFGKWSDAVEFAGLESNPFREPPRPSEITKEELIEEFVRVSNEVGKIPSTNVFRSLSKYSWRPYQTQWGSWRDAVDDIISNHSSNFTFAAETARKVKEVNKRTKLRINLPLAYEPQNEMETVVLFSLLANDLGYRLLKIRSNFPDGLVEYENTEISVEFEFLSSNYLQHCHPTDFNGICICWRA